MVPLTKNMEIMPSKRAFIIPLSEREIGYQMFCEVIENDWKSTIEVCGHVWNDI